MSTKCNNRLSQRAMNFESMEKRELFAADLGMDVVVAEPPVETAPAEIEQIADSQQADQEPVCYLKYKLERAFIKSWSTSGDADDRPTEETQQMDLATPPEATAAVFAKYDGVDGESASGYDDNKYFVADSFSFGVEREMKESGEKGGTEDLNIGVGELQEQVVTEDVDSVFAEMSQATADDRPTEEVAFYYNKIA